MTGTREIGSLLSQASHFWKHLAGVKARLAPKDFEWYPYESLSNLEHLDALLTGRNRWLLDGAGGKLVADICCADGDLAFFLESTGCQVHAIDWPVTNHNSMRGVRLLHSALGSSVEVHTADLDTQFDLPEASYEIVFLLGALYHLKNPFYVLETLSKRAQYCLLSTRIAALSPDGSTVLRDLPIAYLVGEAELNRDNSNYWIFSETGLRRLVHRTNWEVLDYLSIGASGKSDPVNRDERAFCLLRSRYGMANVELLAGWHHIEQTGWRWTEKRFAACAQGSDRDVSQLRLKFYLPEMLAEQWGSLTIRTTVNGVELPAETYARSGDWELLRGFQAASAVRAEFELDHALPPDDHDARERGIIVAGLTFE